MNGLKSLAAHRLLVRQLLAGAMAVAAALTQPAYANDGAQLEYDVLILDGMVFDGTGSHGRVTDIAISGERIVEVGDLPEGATAATIVDASGLIVSPGFIDPHSHAGPGIATPELATAKPILYQGITTIMINPDGGGPGELEKQIDAIRRNVPGVNVIPLIGHNAVRRQIMGDANRKASLDEIQSMKALVRNAMDLGAFGLSSGPFYIPGKYSTTTELAELAKVAAEYPGAFHTSHIRDESNYGIGVLGAIEELIEVSRKANIPGVITHMKMLGPGVWGKSREAVEIVNAARAEGLEIWADQYPYAASGSGLQPALVPAWAQEGGSQALARRLEDPEQRALIRKEMAQNLVRRAGADAVMIRRFPPAPALEGQRLDEIARERLDDPLDVAIDMLIQGGAPIISFNMDEGDLEYLMKQPWMMTSTDGSLVAFGEGSEHPRAYGAFPRKFRRYVLDRQVISMEQAIHSSTGLPAKVFEIEDRGELRPGAFADVTIFDPDTFRDLATYQEPHAYSEGVEYVFVNGKLALADGEVTSERHGRILLRDDAHE